MYDLINKFEKLIIEYNESQKILTIALILTDIVDSDSPYEYTPFPIIDPLVGIYQQFMKENYEQLLMQLILTENTVITDYENTQITLESDYLIDWIDPPTGFVPKGFEEISEKFKYTKLVLHFRGKGESATYEEIPEGYSDIEMFNAYGIPIHHAFPGYGESLTSSAVYMVEPTYIEGQWYRDYWIDKAYVQLIKADDGHDKPVMWHDIFEAFVLDENDISSRFYRSRGKGTLQQTSLWIDATMEYGRRLQDRCWTWIQDGGVTDRFYLLEVPPTPSGYYDVWAYHYTFTDPIVFVPIPTGAGAINVFMPALWLLGMSDEFSEFTKGLGFKPWKEEEE